MEIQTTIKAFSEKIGGMDISPETPITAFARCFNGKCFSDFKTFLASLFSSTVCKGLKSLNLIMDNGSAHAPKQIGNMDCHPQSVL